MLDFRDLVDGTIKKKHGLVSETKRSFSVPCCRAHRAHSEIEERSAGIRSVRWSVVGNKSWWFQLRIYNYIYILYLHVYNNCTYRYIHIWTHTKKKRPLWGLYFDM